jgi:hypothetical protein
VCLSLSELGFDRVSKVRSALHFIVVFQFVSLARFCPFAGPYLTPIRAFTHVQADVPELMRVVRSRASAPPVARSCRSIFRTPSPSPRMQVRPSSASEPLPLHTHDSHIHRPTDFDGLGMHSCKSWQPLSSCLLDRHITAAPFSALSPALTWEQAVKINYRQEAHQKPENSAFLAGLKKRDASLRPDLPSTSRGTWGELGLRAERRAKLGRTRDAGPHRGRCLN